MGGGKTRSGGGSIAINKTKQRQTQQINDSILSLRSAIFSSDGKDKDVLSSIAPAFLTYQRNGLDLSLSLQFALNKDEQKWYFQLIKDHMEEKYDASGLGWDDDDKLMELNENGKRFLVVREKPSDASAKKGNIVGIVHFRFTVQGEVLDVMAGETTLHVSDIHLVEAVQRKGLGKHLLTILELIARKERMSLLSVPVPLEDESTENWLAKCKGFSPDITLPLLGFNSEDEGYEVYVKRLLAPVREVVAPQPVPTNPVPTSNQEPENAKGIIQEAQDMLRDLSLNTSNTSDELETSTDTVSSNEEAEESLVDLNDIDEEDIVAELTRLFKENNSGREPTDEDVSQWLETIRQARNQ